LQPERLGSVLTTDSLLRRLPLSGKARRADPAHSDGPGTGGVARWRRRPNLWLVSALTALAALGYSGFSLLLQHTIRTHEGYLVMHKSGIKG